MQKVDLTLQGFILRYIESELRPVDTDELTEVVRESLPRLRKVNGNKYTGNPHSLVPKALETLRALRRGYYGWEIISEEAAKVFRQNLLNSINQYKDRKRANHKARSPVCRIPDDVLMEYVQSLATQAREDPLISGPVLAPLKDLIFVTEDQMRDKIGNERFEGLLQSFALFRKLFIESFNDYAEFDIPTTLITIHDKVARIESKAEDIDFTKLDTEDADSDSSLQSL
eukprot:CAMPEP_0204917116 /NCGR_PEP_ID=MMETSP1397-20131031/14796_1 /ASSEMBLY_ACC=CAM_ASM_000891 /TAXON_ID=49980 /ORGANISM="Climacostomum Climacostomum virens, Strain Stock W-24" /LENGTH=227 /DNA_ID=CAMNT_0052089881 /DNA_START=550 /DNA_END=1233 /DNA_ORIENTATION=+